MYRGLKAKSWQFQIVLTRGVVRSISNNMAEVAKALTKLKLNSNVMIGIELAIVFILK